MVNGNVSCSGNLGAAHDDIQRELEDLYDEVYKVRDLYHTALWSMCGKGDKISLNDDFSIKDGTLFDERYLQEAKLGALTSSTTDCNVEKSIRNNCKNKYVDFLDELLYVIDNMPLHNFPRSSAEPQVSIKLSDSSILAYYISVSSIKVKSIDEDDLKKISNDKDLTKYMRRRSKVFEEIKSHDVDEMHIKRNDYKMDKYRDDVREVIQKTIFKIRKVYDGLEELENMIINEFQEEIVATKI
jgi:hypothetical protein